MIIGVFNLCGFGFVKTIKSCFNLETYEELQEIQELEEKKIEKKLSKSMLSPSRILARSLSFQDHEQAHYMDVEISRNSLKNTPLSKKLYNKQTILAFTT